MTFLTLGMSQEKAGISDIQTAESMTPVNIPNSPSECCKLSRYFRYVHYHHHILHDPKRWVRTLLTYCPF